MEKHPKFIDLERPPVTETALVVRVVLPGEPDEGVEESLAEIRQLAWTAGAEVAQVFIQRRAKPCSATLIGAGKAEEIAGAVADLDADLVIVDSDLTPRQGSNLENLLGAKVIDRTQLILDIFAMRAHTNEGKHQVELAQLQYMLPRLAGRGSVMRQQGGIGVRGPGEQKLEVDRRVVRKRIARLQDDIETIRKSRHVQRRRRAQDALATVALVGYTNAGKSSLLNTLTSADVLVENKLFATLDPRARRCALPSGREMVLADTVGFIRSLPHSLVAAFRATLEEVNEAGLLLVVADAAHPHVEDHINAVYEVLDEIDALGKPIITVFNKADIADPLIVERLLSGRGTRLAVSARTGEGLDALLCEADDYLASGHNRVTLRIPQSAAGLVARIHQSGRVLSQTYEGNEIVIEAEVGHALEGLVAAYIA
ncbi:MAG: GTPase HflX [Nitrospiraceae bacterium]|nr:GTPase HflX [Nitrospiraceae bacterium]